MASIKKTVFISYRRKDISWALLVYKYLATNGFDVFFDFTSLPGGKFEPIILHNIKARAHFLVILTPSALDRCNEPGDWLQREIKTAIDEERNIVPLFFEGFDFRDSAILDKLSGKLETLKEYNGLEVPARFFDAAMKELCDHYLNVGLDIVLQPLSDEVQMEVEEQQRAAKWAIWQKELIKWIAIIGILGLAILCGVISYPNIQKLIIVPGLTSTQPPATITSPINTPIQFPTNTLLPLTHESTLPPVILYLANGVKVSRLIDVFVSVDQSALDQGNYLNIVVFANGSSTFSVQAIPEIQPDGTWRSSPVFIGREGAADIGKTFQICAVSYRQQLHPEEISFFPTGPKSCIDVIRE